MRLVRSIILGLGILTVGAGCTQPAPRPSSNESATDIVITDPACTTTPTENETGRTVYPIAARYERLPHLGQIFTAMDCGNLARVEKMIGFQSGAYIAGVSLTWNTPPPEAASRSLGQLDFVQTENGTWRSNRAFTLEELKALQDILSDPEAAAALKQEDCIVCG